MSTDHWAGPLKKADLRYVYRPSGHMADDMIAASEPDAQELRRHEWYDMLFFINKFANTNGLCSQGVAKHAEKLIQEKVPLELRSHEQIRKWLLENWKYFS